MKRLKDLGGRLKDHLKKSYGFADYIPDEIRESSNERIRGLAAISESVDTHNYTSKELHSLLGEINELSCSAVSCILDHWYDLEESFGSKKIFEEYEKIDRDVNYFRSELFRKVGLLALERMEEEKSYGRFESKSLIPETSFYLLHLSDISREDKKIVEERLNKLYRE